MKSEIQIPETRVNTVQDEEIPGTGRFQNMESQKQFLKPSSDIAKGSDDPNEETFGQILMSSRDPCRISQLFEEKKKENFGERSDSNILLPNPDQEQQQTLKEVMKSAERVVESKTSSKMPESNKSVSEEEPKRSISTAQMESKPPLRTAENFYKTRAALNVQVQGLAAANNVNSADRQRANSINYTASNGAKVRSGVSGQSVGGGIRSNSPIKKFNSSNKGGSGQDSALEPNKGDISVDQPIGNKNQEVFSQQMSFDNFNSYANKVNNQVHLSQGGGGFARGTIFKGGKEWRIGGMAANANLNNSAISGTNYKPRQMYTRTMGGNSNINNIVMQRQTSEAGSRQSFATHKRGLPRTLWQKGAVFSTRMSRASVSAGKHIPQYQGLPFQPLSTTQAFFQARYEQIAHEINQDITENQRQSLKIVSNMSESGAYGLGPHTASKTKSNNRKRLTDLQRLNPTNIHQKNQFLYKAQSNIEYSGKNRPFSSENKYGNMRRFNPNLNISKNVEEQTPVVVQNPYNNIDFVESSMDEKALSERKSIKQTGFILPPINRVNQEIKNLITEDIDMPQNNINNDVLSEKKNETQVFSKNDENEPYKTNYEKKEERMLMQRFPEIVWLRIYHVTSFNKYLLEWLGFGFYHTSIELYNHEFAYGGHDFDFSGIVCVETVDEKSGDPAKVKQQQAASGGLELKERIPIGITFYSMDEIDDIVIYFGNFWHGQDYDPFSRNCNHFAQLFISHICDKEQYYYPSYINRFTKLGSMLRGWFKPLQTIFGEIVDLNQNEDEEHKVDEWGYEIADDYMPVVAVVPAAQKKAQLKPPIVPIQNDEENPKTFQRQVSIISQIQHPDSPRKNLKHFTGGILSPKSGNKNLGESMGVMSQTKNTQLNALLQSPTQNIKVSQIIATTQQKQQSNELSEKSDRKEKIDSESFKTSSPLPKQLIGMEEPVENIKQRADEHFALNQFQQAMKFYEICLGKITSITNIDINEDPYMMNLTIQTYLGICDSALKLGLHDHLMHFSSQCIKLDPQNSEMHLVYQKRAIAHIKMNRKEQALKDLKTALYLAQSQDVESQQEQIQVIQEEIKKLEEEMKEEEDSASDRSFKDALDHFDEDEKPEIENTKIEVVPTGSLIETDVEFLQKTLSPQNGSININKQEEQKEQILKTNMKQDLSVQKPKKKKAKESSDEDHDTEEARVDEQILDTQENDQLKHLF